MRAEEGRSRGEMTLQEQVRKRRSSHVAELTAEIERLTREAAAMGAERVVLFGSAARGQAGLTSDLDLLIVWDSHLDFVNRCAEAYRRLKPRVAADLLVYTPDEMTQMKDRPFVRHALAEGKVLYAA